MSRRVLMSGASGFVGANVLGYLLERTDWSFVCVASWRHKGRPARLAGLCQDHPERVDVVTHDLRAPLPSLGDFHSVLHLASESHVDRAIADPVPFVENNVAVTLHMLEYTRYCTKASAFVQFSTDEVWGDTGDGPSNPYAASKAAQEAIALAYRRTYALPLIITNSNNIIGPGQDPEKFVPKAAAAIRAGDEVAIHAHDGQMGSRHYNPVGNIAAALHFILDRGLLGTFQIPGGLELTNLQMAQEIASTLDLPMRYRIIDVEGTRPGYDLSYAAASDNGTLAQHGWTPPVSFSDGLCEALR